MSNIAQVPLLMLHHRRRKADFIEYPRRPLRRLNPEEFARRKAELEARENPQKEDSR